MGDSHDRSFFSIHWSDRHGSFTVEEFYKANQVGSCIEGCRNEASMDNNLREAMASFQSYGVTPDLDHTGHREFYEHGTKIELLMNPKDPDYDELQGCLYSFLNANTLAEKFSANPQYVAVCQRILKREWEVLKREIAAAG